MNHFQKKSRFAQMALALSFLIGSFSLFSITFGLQRNNSVAFYTNNEDQLIYEKISELSPISQSLFSFSDETNTYEQIEPRYILQQLDRLGSIRAQSFLVGDLDTGEVIFERKPHTEYAIASISKYMTAYTAAEILNPNEVVTITRESVNVPGGNRAFFKIGDTLTVRELIYPLLLVSANDAGEMIAHQRNRDYFIRSMNDFSQEMGMENTQFEDPTGLSPNNISTARDLFTLMRGIRTKYPEIIDISRLSFKENKSYFWTNINKSSNIEEFRGGKTGYTNAARQTSIAYYQVKLANDQIKNIAVIILQSDTREQDTRNVINYLKRYVAYL